MLEDLDDNLASRHGIRDIVDTTPFKDGKNADLSGDDILKVSHHTCMALPTD